MSLFLCLPSSIQALGLVSINAHYSAQEGPLLLREGSISVFHHIGSATYSERTVTFPHDTLLTWQLCIWVLTFLMSHLLDSKVGVHSEKNESMIIVAFSKKKERSYNHPFLTIDTYRHMGERACSDLFILACCLNTKSPGVGLNSCVSAPVFDLSLLEQAESWSSYKTLCFTSKTASALDLNYNVFQLACSFHQVFRNLNIKVIC